MLHTTRHLTSSLRRRPGSISGLISLIRAIRSTKLSKLRGRQCTALLFLLKRCTLHWKVGQPIFPQSVFSECVRECPQLVVFQGLHSNWPSARTCGAPDALCKLVLQGSQCQFTFVVHSFPHLLSLTIDMSGLHFRSFRDPATSKCSLSGAL